MNIILIGILISWLPVGYISARVCVWAGDNLWVDSTTGKKVKMINNDQDRLVFLFGIFGGYITLVFSFILLSPIGMWLSVALLLLVAIILHLDKVLPWTGRKILSTARRLSL